MDIPDHIKVHFKYAEFVRDNVSIDDLNEHHFKEGLPIELINKMISELKGKRKPMDKDDVPASDPVSDPVSDNLFWNEIFIRGIIFGSLPLGLSLGILSYAYQKDMKKNRSYPIAMSLVILLIVLVPFVARRTGGKLKPLLQKGYTNIRSII